MAQVPERRNFELEKKEAEEQATATIAQKKLQLRTKIINLAPNLVDKLNSIAMGEERIKQEVVTKDGDKIEIELKPSFRVMTDAADKLLEKVVDKQSQVEHTGVIGFALEKMNEPQIDNEIIKIHQQQNAIEVKAEIVDE